MSLLFADSFDHYATADLLKKYTTIRTTGGGGIDPTGGRRGGGAFQIKGSSGDSIARSITAAATVIVGFAWRPTESGGSRKAILSLSEASATHITLNFNSSNHIEVLRGDSSGTLLAASDNVFSVDSYVYLELKVTIADSGGSFELRANGVVTASGSGIDTRNGGTGVIDRVTLGDARSSLPSSASSNFDDLYVLNTSGATNNDFLGDVRIDAAVVSASGSSTQFTPSAGANYECVDDPTPDDDATYVSSSTQGHLDLFNYGDLSHNPPAIFGVQICTLARKDDASAISLQAKSRVGGVTRSAGGSWSLLDTYAYQMTTIETDPDTSSDWTQSGINAAEFGFEVV